MSSTLSFLDPALDCGPAFSEEDVDEANESYTECAASFPASIPVSPARAKRFTPPGEVLDFPNAMRILQLELRISDLTRQCKTLQNRVSQLEETAPSVVVPINTFAPKPFELIKPVLALVEPVIDENGEPCEYIASFVDGALSATGDTLEEAIALLKSRMTSQYRFLASLPADRLGRTPQRQLTALRSVMRRIE